MSDTSLFISFYLFHKLIRLCVVILPVLYVAWSCRCLHTVSYPLRYRKPVPTRCAKPFGPYGYRSFLALWGPSGSACGRKGLFFMRYLCAWSYGHVCEGNIYKECINLHYKYVCLVLFLFLELHYILAYFLSTPQNFIMPRSSSVSKF